MTSELVSYWDWDSRAIVKMPASELMPGLGVNQIADGRGKSRLVYFDKADARTAMAVAIRSDPIMREAVLDYMGGDDAGDPIVEFVDKHFDRACDIMLMSALGSDKSAG